MTGVRFLFRVALRRHDLAAEVWHIKEPQKLPPVLSPTEVKRVLIMATSLQARAMLSSALGRGAGPSRHGGLWRWCIAWVTDRGVDAIETAGTGPLVAISGYHSWWREERQDTGATT